MKTIILNKTVLILFMGIIAQFKISAQIPDMYVKANSYVYTSNQYVYVKNNIELNAATSNFYLRNEGQLLQGTTGLGANKGVGSLSVFQEGTVSNFQYNYWCSPVGSTNSSTAINNNFGITQLGVPTTVTETTPAIMLASNIYDGTASPFAIAPFWIYKFTTNKSSYSDWLQVGSATTIKPGEGFTMKGSSGTNATIVDGVQNNPDGKHQRYDFRGKPNDGTISIPVLVGELTLTGNPYPSAIDLAAFLQGESNCTGVAYFWEQDKSANSHYIADYKGGYGCYSPGAGGDVVGIYSPAVFFTYDGLGNQISTSSSPNNMYERKYSPIGQGFLIAGSANGNVQMKNSYRIFVKEGVENLSQLEKHTIAKTAVTVKVTPQIRFSTLLNNKGISQMVLAFDPTATDGVDRAKDASYVNNGPANNSFIINNKEFIIQSIPFDVDKAYAIGFRNTVKANYKITVNQILNLPEVENVYLHDKTTNLYYDIKNSFYELALPAGTNNTQYEITFKKDISLSVKNIENKDFVVYENNSEKNLIINNPFQKELTSCGLYDVAGKLIFLKNKLGTDSVYKFSTTGLSEGIYIVKLITNENNEIGVKIIVKN